MADWETRESVESVRLHLMRLISHLNDLKSKTKAHEFNISQHVDRVERKLEQLEVSLDRAQKKEPIDSGESK